MLSQDFVIFLDPPTDVFLLLSLDFAGWPMTILLLSSV